jgi:peptide-methionine (S)-S-oxide reductase
VAPGDAETAIFAGGCFWCTESDFEKLPGVYEAISGYSGGVTDDPTYRAVTFGDTGHYEVVQVIYDGGVVSYETLVEYFFRTIDPTDDGGQFCDRGSSYRTAIFVDGEEERETARRILERLDDRDDLDPIVTPILDEAPFYQAEAYHQNYARLNNLAYRAYRAGCGRDARLRELWGDEAGGRAFLD